MPETKRSGFFLDDYVTVAERVTAFYGKYPEGSLQSEIVEMNPALVVIRAYAYRTPDDPRPGLAVAVLGGGGAAVTSPGHGVITPTSLLHLG
jgi:hypothetical protein